MFSEIGRKGNYAYNPPPLFKLTLNCDPDVATDRRWDFISRGTLVDTPTVARNIEYSYHLTPKALVT